MRKYALGFVAAGYFALSGCAPRFAANDDRPVLASPGNVTPAYNAQPAPSAIDKSVEAVRSGSAKLVAWTKPEPKPQPLNDALSLDNMPTKVTPNLHISMAKLMERQGNAAGAEKHYQDGLRLSPNDVSLHLAYAHLLDREGRFSEAKERYIAAAKIAPQDPTTHNDLGLCYARHQQFDLSLEALNYAVKLSPKKVLYRNNIATLLVEMDRKEEAWQQLKAVHPPAVAHYNFAFLLNKKQDTQAAMQHFAYAAKLDPSMTAARQWAARLQAQANRANVRNQPAAPESTGPSLGTPGGAQARYPNEAAATGNPYGDRYPAYEANSEPKPRYDYYAPR